MTYREVFLQSDIIYGPVISRRLGLSLGINLLPTTMKFCSFNCIYCQYGLVSAIEGQAELPDKGTVIEKVEQALKSKTEFAYITFSGNGEATLHPEFYEIAESVRDLRNKYRENAKLAILSNSTNLTEKNLEAINTFIDRPIMKLDAGLEKTFTEINRPVIKITLEEIVKSLSLIGRLNIQALFFKGEISNFTEPDVSEWVRILKELNPLEVQIYTLSRKFYYEGIEKLTDDELKLVAEIGKNAGINIIPYFN